MRRAACMVSFIAAFPKGFLLLGPSRIEVLQVKGEQAYFLCAALCKLAADAGKAETRVKGHGLGVWRL